MLTSYRILIINHTTILLKSKQLKRKVHGHWIFLTQLEVLHLLSVIYTIRKHKPQMWIPKYTDL